MSERIPEADFDALAIDVHLTTDGQEAALTIVSPVRGWTVSLPRKALEELRDRISRELSCSASPFRWS
jgi:hypothetical protein